MELSFGWTYFVLWFLVAAQGLILLAVLRELESLRTVEPQHPAAPALIGQPAPSIRFTDARAKSEHGLEVLGPHPGVLLFLSSTCGTCRRLANGLVSLPIGAPNVVVMWKDGAVDEIDSRLHCCTNEADAIAATYGVERYPTAVLLDAQHLVVAITNPVDVEQLHRLIDGGISALPVGPILTVTPVPVG